MRERGATQIIVAHRPAVIRYVNRILVMSEGHIQMLGPRDEILEKLNSLRKNP